MRLRLEPMTDGEVHAQSFGRISRAVFPKPDDAADLDGTLYDPKCFGPEQDWVCACGAVRGEAEEGNICGICGVRVGISAELTRSRFGLIDLCVPVEHPLVPDRMIRAVPVLPIGYRRERTPGYDLNLLYSRLLQGNSSVRESGADNDREAVEELTRCVAQLFCNDYLDSPAAHDGRPLRSIMYLLLEDPGRSLTDVGVLMIGLGLKLVASPTK